MLSDRILAYMNDYERLHAEHAVGTSDHWASEIASAIGASVRSTAVALTHLCGRGLVTSAACKVGGKLYSLTRTGMADSPQEASDA